MAASLFLQACFYTESGDSPYTVPAGENFEQAQLEIDSDGSVLIMTQAAQLYRHQAPVNDWDTGVTVRNFHSILFRRTEGGWSATPFRNIQENSGGFPVLLPVSGGGFQAYVQDARTLRRYVRSGGEWVRQPGTSQFPGYSRYYVGFSAGSSMNWYRMPALALANDSLTVVLDMEWDDDLQLYKVEAREAGRRSVLVGVSFQPLAFHADNLFRGVLGLVSFRPSDTASAPENQLVYAHWAPGDSIARRFTLSTAKFQPDVYFGPYAGGLALLMGSSEGFRAFPLDREGLPGDPVELPFPGKPGTYVPTFAVDGRDCVHRLEGVYDTTRTTMRYHYWNSCDPDLEETLDLPAAAPGMGHFVRSTHLRIGPGDVPMASFVVQEITQGDQMGRIGESSKLVFAARRDGKWTLETVSEK